VGQPVGRVDLPMGRVDVREWRPLRRGAVASAEVMRADSIYPRIDISSDRFSFISNLLTKAGDEKLVCEGLVYDQAQCRWPLSRGRAPAFGLTLPDLLAVRDLGHRMEPYCEV
jgi:hypothetical protein